MSGLVVNSQGKPLKCSEGRLLQVLEDAWSLNGYRIVRINPENMKTEDVVHPDTRDSFGDAATALEIDGEVWLGAHPGDRVAYFRSGVSKR